MRGEVHQKKSTIRRCDGIHFGTQRFRFCTPYSENKFRLLEPGMQLRLGDGSPAYVTGVEATGIIEPVYNFSVDGWKTYHVGELGVWAHNVCDLSSIRGPHPRHWATRVNPRSVAKTNNTVIEPRVDVSADLQALRDGLGEVSSGRYSINGRVYGIHSERFYPISGDGFHMLDRGAYKALGVYNQFGNSSRASTILDNMGISEVTRRNAMNVWELLQ